MYILRHILTVAELERKKLFTAFLDLTAAYDSVQREKLWAHLQHIHVPEYLLSAIRALYQDSVYIAVDGDGVRGNYGNSGSEAGMPAEPSTKRSFHKRLGQVPGYVGSRGHDSLANCQSLPL